MQRLALALLLFTGQRRSDAVRMGRQHRTGNTLAVVQVKTRARLTIPLHRTLRDVLDATECGELTYLINGWGKPFASSNAFGNWFRDACDVAGLKTLAAHGLRKAAARRLAEAGCTTKQIAAITGHKTLSEIERYTEAADQERLARDAMARIEG